jgi:hypothetical protein
MALCTFRELAGYCHEALGLKNKIPLGRFSSVAEAHTEVLTDFQLYRSSFGDSDF